MHYSQTIPPLRVRTRERTPRTLVPAHQVHSRQDVSCYRVTADDDLPPFLQIIAVHADDPEFSGYSDISEIPKHRLAEIKRL